MGEFKAAFGRLFCFMVSGMVLSQTDANHLLKQQHVSMANGTGKSWLFVQYEYTRWR